MRVLRNLPILLSLLPLVAFSETAALSDVRFAQISDPHLFDGGKKRELKNATSQQIALDKEKRDSERLDTWAAWDWALNYVKHLNAVQPLDFVVITGDFGLEKVADQKTYADIEYIDSKTKLAAANKKSEECWFLNDAVDEIVDAFRSLPVERIYVVPGNNDINDEDPSDDRFHQFIAEVNKKLNGRIIDLNLVSSGASSSTLVGGYTIIGLDSSSFKNKVPAPVSKSTQLGCPFPPKQNARTRDSYQLQEIQRVKSLVQEPSLLFTHIPDMDDPLCVRSGSNCSSVSSWNLSYAARETWNNLVFDPKVRGIFAGHFHDSRRETYKRPYDWPLTRNDKYGTSLEKTYVVPPLSPKFQIDDVSGQSRGFALITITPKDIIWKPYWLNTLPIMDRIHPDSQSTKESENGCCIAVIVIAAVIFAIFCFIWTYAGKRANERSKTSSLAVLGPDATKWAEHLFREWKYRHDNFWRTLYRFFAAIAILVTVPFVKSEYFGPIAGFKGSLTYSFLPLIIFCSLCFVLPNAQAKLKYVERWLDKARQGDKGELEDPTPWKELRTKPTTAFLFVGLGLILWALWACTLLNRYAGMST